MKQVHGPLDWTRNRLRIDSPRWILPLVSIRLYSSLLPGCDSDVGWFEVIVHAYSLHANDAKVEANVDIATSIIQTVQLASTRASVRRDAQGYGGHGAAWHRFQSGAVPPSIYDVHVRTTFGELWNSRFWSLRVSTWNSRGFFRPIRESLRVVSCCHFVSLRHTSPFCIRR